MIGLHSLRRILVCTAPTDMRKSFDGLCGCVEQYFHDDPVNGNMFVFFNRKRTMVKMLLWDRSGFWIFAKRLESGTFSPRLVNRNSEVDMAELLCILDGIDLDKSYRKKRFSIAKKT
ncbi:MAG: IS66 family insertion sequence element accessory protein TnpB [Chitinivibrionales bacterium]|nr:IS66 family insertion sequence element accessory protein TnpB [Chitinivibrionales bacterium]